jgi:hypothetical protein
MPCPVRMTVPFAKRRPRNFARHAPGNPGNCLRRRIDPLRSRGSEKPILNATIAPVHAARAALHQNLVANFRCESYASEAIAAGGQSMSAVPPIASEFCAPQRKTPSTTTGHCAEVP